MQEFTITQLTDNNVDDKDAQTSKGNAVWTASDGNDDEIFFYDGESSRRLTYNDDFDNTPRISGNNLAWQQTESDPLLSIFDGSEVVVYDGETETIETIAEVDSLTLPDISGNNVVWGEDFIFGGTVFLYNGKSISELTDNGAFIPISSSVFGNNIVWTSGFDENLEGYGDIFLYDGRTTTQITDNASDNFVNALPSVSGGNIAWTGSEISIISDETTGDVFFYDGEAEEIIQLTDDDVLNAVIGVSGDNVIWSSGDGLTESELFLYDGEETIQLTSDRTKTFTGASISGNQVVWSESDGNDTEIFLYDGEETIQITDNDLDDFAPDINQGTIVWSGDDGNDTEIFLATLEEAERGNSSNSTGNRFQRNNTGSFYTADKKQDAVEDIDLLTGEKSTEAAFDTTSEKTTSQDITDFGFAGLPYERAIYSLSIGEIVEDNLIDSQFAEADLILPSEEF